MVTLDSAWQQDISEGHQNQWPQPYLLLSWQTPQFSIAERILNLRPEACPNIPLPGAWGCCEYSMRSDTLKQTVTFNRTKGQGGTFGNFLSTASFLQRWSSLLQATWQLLVQGQRGSGRHSFVSSFLPSPWDWKNQIQSLWLCRIE